MVSAVTTRPRKATQGAAPPQTSPPTRTPCSNTQTPMRFLPLHHSGMPLVEWSLTPKELDAFSGPVELSSSDNDTSGSSEVEVRVITSKFTLNTDTIVEGIANLDPFLAAHERNLHGSPVSPLGMEPEGPFYVVFRGRNPGIYPTWSAASYQLTGVPGATSKKYATIEKAREAWNHAVSNGTAGHVDTDGLIIQSPSKSSSRKDALATAPLSHSDSPINSGSTAAAAAPMKEAERQVQKGKKKLLGTQMKEEVCFTDIVVDNAKRARNMKVTVKQSGKKDCPPADVLVDDLPSPQPRNIFQNTPSTTVITKSKKCNRPQQHVPLASDVASASGFNQDDQFFIVLSGQHPGIYMGRSHAQAQGIGATDLRKVRVEVAGDCTQANQMFVNAWMSGCVECL